jgi:hypothetical protein
LEKRKDNRVIDQKTDTGNYEVYHFAGRAYHFANLNFKKKNKESQQCEMKKARQRAKGVKKQKKEKWQTF